MKQKKLKINDFPLDQCGKKAMIKGQQIIYQGKAQKESVMKIKCLFKMTGEVISFSAIATGSSVAIQAESSGQAVITRTVEAQPCYQDQVLKSYVLHLTSTKDWEQIP